LTDLKAISSDARMFWRLFQTVKNFLAKLRDEPGPHRPRITVNAHPNDTYESVIRKLAEHKIHRLFVVDESKKPVGVIGLKDSLLELISH